MTILARHFQALLERYSDAVLTPQDDGTHVVSVPQLPLPTGWNRSVVDISFLVPAGYPQAVPDCFWTAPGLALAHGGAPQNTGQQFTPGIPGDWVWFSWHPGTWNPNSDSLLTYLNVIRKRLNEPV